MKLSKVLRTIVSISLVALCSAAGAQDGYPSKPIKIQVGVPPGGSTDALTRMFAEWLQDSMGQPTVVENRPGANTSIAADGVARAQPDGHTLLVATEAFISMPLLIKAPFDPFKDFVPIGGIAIGRFVLAVHPTVPARTLQDFIAYAKTKPGKLNYGSAGNASGSHQGGEKLNMMSGTKLIHIPYRGAGPALSDALAGQTEVALFTPMAVAPHVKAGKLRALAVTGTKRNPALPDVPTFAEAGLPQYEHHTWLALYAPVGTPKPIVDRLNAEIRKMAESPKYKKRMEDVGAEPLLMTPEKLTEMMRKETVETAKLIKDANIKMD